ncbi:MAG: PotD/PotF family extracellular solute-binding protein [Alphaproteobacteria bacterium]|nr:PotD/PotF family extracellular solute-binding protein [Pseudomonadota bacterium]
MPDMKTTRRRFLKGAGAAAATLGASALLPKPGHAADRALHLNCWDGYSDPRLHDKFLEEQGTRIKAELLISDPDAINRLRAGEIKVWDIINLNQPWARQIMWPEGLIRDIPKDRFEPYFEKMLPEFQPPFYWASSEDGEHLLGVCQRFDTGEFVINSDVIDWRTAQEVGWDLFNDKANAGRIGMLAYDNWNIMNACMGAGVDPFKPHSEEEIASFDKTIHNWMNATKFISDDFVQMNLAMVNGEIDLYYVGSTYTCSGARLDGLWNLLAITPASGPSNGRGGINWIELTSVVNNPDLHPKALDFLEFILQPEIAYIVGTADGLLQPVAQMSQPEVLNRYTKDQLRAIQYDDPNGLQWRLDHAAQMDINPDYDLMYEIYLDAKRAREAA